MKELFDKLVASWRGAPWWKKILIGIAIVFVAIGVVATAVFFLGRRSDPQEHDPAVDLAVGRGDLVDDMLDANEARDRELAAEGDRLREEREEIEDRIDNAGEGRNEFHEELDRAADRGDIDGILAARDRRRGHGSADD